MTILPWLVPFIGASAVLLLVAYTPLWRLRKVLGQAAMALLIVSAFFVASFGLPLAAIIFLLVIFAWLFLVAARLPFGRLDEPFLQTSTRLNTWLGVAAVSLVLGLAAFLAYVPTFVILHVVAAVSVLVAAAFLSSILWTFRKFTLPRPSLSLRQLPTVSVCIPARNEDQELSECISLVLDSDYPKLEVIVLDDCSQDKTAQIIRSFAHDGVRFVQGDTPASGWLGKNQAMQTLAEHASGEWLFFMSADTRVASHSISQIVHYALEAKREMVSILPQNKGAVGLNTVFGTLQYFWQIALPLTNRRVPVSGKSWLIRAETLKNLGSFSGVKHKIVPEGSFARQLQAKNAFRFYVSNAQTGLTTVKTRRAQVRTSIRLLYPTFKRQPFFVLAALALLTTTLLWPFVALYFFGGTLFVLHLLASILLTFGYLLVLMRTHPTAWPIGILVFPLVLAQEAVLMLASMLAYEFNEVSWKGRNVCYPVISSGRTSRLPANLGLPK